MPGSLHTFTNLIPMLVLWGIGPFYVRLGEYLIQLMNGRAKVWIQFFVGGKDTTSYRTWSSIIKCLNKGSVYLEQDILGWVFASAYSFTYIHFFFPTYTHFNAHTLK